MRHVPRQPGLVGVRINDVISDKYCSRDGVERSGSSRVKLQLSVIELSFCTRSSRNAEAGPWVSKGQAIFFANPELIEG